MKSAARRRLNEPDMIDEKIPAPKPRLNAHRRDLRRARIFGRLPEGWAYDEIGRDEGLTRIGGAKGWERKMPWGSAQLLEKAQSGQGNQSQFLCFIWPGLAQFGQIWLNSALACIFPWDQAARIMAAPSRLQWRSRLCIPPKPLYPTVLFDGLDKAGVRAFVGGMLGFDDISFRGFTDTYWDTTVSGVTDPAKAPATRRTIRASRA